MQTHELFTEVSNLLEAAKMMGHYDQKQLRATMVEAIAADTGLPIGDVRTLLLLYNANRSWTRCRSAGAACERREPGRILIPVTPSPGCL